jgi:hypothetical protein
MKSKYRYYIFRDIAKRKIAEEVIKYIVKKWPDIDVFDYGHIEHAIEKIGVEMTNKEMQMFVKAYLCNKSKKSICAFKKVNNKFIILDKSKWETIDEYQKVHSMVNYIAYHKEVTYDQIKNKFGKNSLNILNKIKEMGCFEMNDERIVFVGY